MHHLRLLLATVSARHRYPELCRVEEPSSLVAFTIGSAVAPSTSAVASLPGNAAGPPSSPSSRSPPLLSLVAFVASPLQPRHRLVPHRRCRPGVLHRRLAIGALPRSGSTSPRHAKAGRCKLNRAQGLGSPSVIDMWGPSAGFLLWLPGEPS
ncbi:hypothetical protein E2562_010334 [Oryza meyeriana var. granulata]|uniref:Uncharacterized protein n=1 Tax=Oryza meyeriana var. granulata TaxID=110450 RepID=A0A6G1F6F7_9ORYZ|nr:hypothetical protein E2562_010334 [Oryza meyeriana var. granulata]